MAAPEAPLCYVGIAKQSAAFRLMKQMVVFFSPPLICLNITSLSRASVLSMHQTLSVCDRNDAKGWEEGEGLGKDKQGIKGYVKVKNKQDTSGMGLDKAANNWAFDTSQFDSILRRLKVKVADSKDGETNDAQADATDTISQEERATKATRPQGRYKRRESGKLVNTYSAKDLQGILVSKVEDAKTNNDEDGDRELPEEFESDACHMTDSSISLEWWGHKHGFVSGGFLGAQSFVKLSKSSQHHATAQPLDERTAFAEEDQENLYKLVQDKATTGKQGLGIKNQPKKIAGCHWKGKKTSFDDSDGDSVDDSGSLKRKRSEKPEVGEHDEPKPKLKRICKQLLHQAPGQSLKVKQLKVLIETQSACFFSAFSSKHEALSYLKKKAQRSNLFSLLVLRLRYMNLQPGAVLNTDEWFVEFGDGISPLIQMRKTCDSVKDQVAYPAALHGLAVGTGLE
ncbi:hypothetical protein ACLOJK_032226 [Asimina triloba]